MPAAPPRRARRKLFSSSPSARSSGRARSFPRVTPGVLKRAATARYCRRGRPLVILTRLKLAAASLGLPERDVDEARHAVARVHAQLVRARRQTVRTQVEDVLPVRVAEEVAGRRGRG